jgi:predicted signal transduction protein with EAL and GGDEF domain
MVSSASLRNGTQEGGLQQALTAASMGATQGRRQMQEVGSSLDERARSVSTTHRSSPLTPDEGQDRDDLLKSADIGLKTGGRGSSRKAMDDRIRLRRGLELNLRDALKNDELELHYQPIVDLDAYTICGCEALLC